ncbi:hypothetical protein D3C72_2244910 [compost metagenome]
MIGQVHGVCLLVLRLAQAAIGKVGVQRPDVGGEILHGLAQPHQCHRGVRRGRIQRRRAGDRLGQVVAHAAAQGKHSEGCRAQGVLEQRGLGSRKAL